MLKTLIAALVLATCVPAAAQSPQTAEPAAEESPVTTQDIEELIATLEDPAAREELVGQLKLLLEAREETAAPPGEGVVDLITGMATGLWERIVSIDPRRALVAGTLTAAIILGALVLRWLLLVLLRKLYGRLAGVGRKPPEQTVERPDEAAEEKDREEEAEEKDREEALREEPKVVLPGTITRILTLLIGVTAALLIAETWGAGVGRLLATDLGARLAESAVAIALILIITVVLWNAAEVVIQRVLRVATRGLDRERSARRLNTLVPLLRSVLQAAIGVLAALLLLSEVGVNIGPLLAGAGILGLAIGFGAQSLVKDLITGVTILLEDGATVGDVIEVAGHAGVVEEMRIRVIQLRDLSGNVHLVPYSDVTTIKNFTKEFSYYLFEVGVAYREDTDEVCEVLMGISKEMQQDATFGPDILEPLEILGVDKFADSAVIIKARMKTKPIRQWAIGREFNRRMKKRFDERDIEIPFPHTTLYFGEPKEGRPPPLHLVRDEPSEASPENAGSDGEDGESRERGRRRAESPDGTETKDESRD